MRRADQLQKIMTALRRCVEQCRREQSPLVALEKNLENLRTNPDFTAEEIAEIEGLARRALAACAPLSAMSPGCSTASETAARCS